MAQRTMKSKTAKGWTIYWLYPILFFPCAIASVAIWWAIFDVPYGHSMPGSLGVLLFAQIFVTPFILAHPVRTLLVNHRWINEDQPVWER